MAAFDTSRPNYGAAPVVSTVFSSIARLASAVVAWNDARITRNVLASLSDRELEDIGLVRGDIDVVADPHFIR